MASAHLLSANVNAAVRDGIHFALQRLDLHTTTQSPQCQGQCSVNAREGGTGDWKVCSVPLLPQRR
jgi:hypothetical protein